MISHEVAPCPGIFSLAPAHRCVPGRLDTPQSSPLGHRLPEFFLLHCRCVPTTLLWVSVAQPRRGFSRLATCVLCRVQMWCLSPTSILHDLFPSWVARALLFARDVYLRSGWPGPHVPGCGVKDSLNVHSCVVAANPLAGASPVWDTYGS